MIVKWNAPRMKVIPVDFNSVEGEKRAALSGKTDIMLYPGSNEVNDADWNAVRGQVANELKDGLITEIGAAPTEQGVIKPLKMNKIGADRAITIINDTVDFASLDKWMKEEIRDEVRFAIKNRIDVLNKPLQK